MEPKVSIITPCLNSENTIRDTIERVLSQSYPNIEYIIVDGGSDDHTVGIIQEYMPLFHGRLKYVSEKDAGIYNAMNKGIRMSEGELIGIINSDDFYEKDIIQRIIKHYKRGRYQVIYGSMRVIFENGISYICKDHHRALLQAMIPHPTCFVSRNVYRDFGMYLESFKLASDYEFMLRIHKTGFVHFQCMHEVISNFRRGGASENRQIAYEVSVIRFLYGGLTFREFIEKLAADSLQG